MEARVMPYVRLFYCGHLTHFGHQNIIKYSNRPFASVEEMDEVLVTNWNRVVRPEDTIYHLGDVVFGDASILKRLQGKKHLIIGSHDNVKNIGSHFIFYTPLLNITIEGQPVTLCHYAMRTWHRSHYGAWNLYGHSHGKLPPIGKSMDVGVDANNYMPVSWTQIKASMSTQPDNFNQIKKT